MVTKQLLFSFAVSTLLLSAGQSGQQPAQSGGAPIVAGKVTREVPKGTVERQGQQSPLVVNDPVDWDDTVHTQDKGRLQITLKDGSVLSVGSRSEMKIVKADAEKQQTDIDLVSGTVKADVQKVTKSGGHFQIHTKTAVIGVIGTTLLAKSDDRGTTVCNVTKNSNGQEAEVVVTDVNGTQTQKLKSGFCAFFPLAGAAVALSASVSASTIAGMTTATVVTTAAAVGTGTVVAVAGAGAAGASLGGLAAAGTFSSGPSASPSGQ